MKYRTLLSLMFLFPLVIKSQDVHFSNNGIISTFINPAYNGAFQGNIRASAVYRDQSTSFFPEGYKTAILAVDSPIAYGLNKNHWIGVGLQLYNDKAGSLGLRRNGYGIGASYHVGLDKDYNTVISIGLNYGNISTDIDAAAAAWATPDIVDLGNYKHTQSNIGLGVKFKTQLSNKAYFETGASLQRITATSASRDSFNNIESRFNINMLLSAALTKRVRLTPEFYFSKSSHSSDMSLHLFPEFTVGKERNFTLRPGLGLRFGDAMIMHIGALYKQWKINLSYDMTVSSAADFNNGNGGFEIGLQRIFIFNRKPKTKLKLICPRL